MMKILLYIPTFFGVSIEVYLILLILDIPTFFIWQWILKKFIKVDKTRKNATWIATIVDNWNYYLGFRPLMVFFTSNELYFITLILLLVRKTQQRLRRPATAKKINPHISTR